MPASCIILSFGNQDKVCLWSDLPPNTRRCSASAPSPVSSEVSVSALRNPPPADTFTASTLDMLTRGFKHHLLSSTSHCSSSHTFLLPVCSFFCLSFRLLGKLARVRIMGHCVNPADYHHDCYCRGKCMRRYDVAKIRQVTCGRLYISMLSRNLDH